MKRICLFLLGFTIIFTFNDANAHMEARAAVPSPVAGAAIKTGYHRHLTITYDSDGNIIATEVAGIDLVVNAAIVADGYGQIAMLTYGTLNKDGQEDPVESLSEGQKIEPIGWNLGFHHIHELKAMYCSAIGYYIADSKDKTGDFTLKGESVFATTSSRAEITVTAGAFSFKEGGNQNTIQTRTPMFVNYSFPINFIEKYKCSGCLKVYLKDTEDACDVIESGKHSFQDDDDDDDCGEEGGGVDPSLGISPANPNQIPQPSDRATMNLVTDEPYYWVDWYVLAPWETSGRGTHQERDNGYGGFSTLSEAALSYTFPSGSMHTGDFLITAVICRWSDMSEYEETYTVTVQNPGIYPTNTVAAGASPGEAYELKVVTDEDFYTITWFVKREGETGRGTQVDYDYGGAAVGNEATMSYTYNVIGNYVITAVIYRGSDMSEYEETYTLICDS